MTDASQADKLCLELSVIVLITWLSLQWGMEGLGWILDRWDAPLVIAGDFPSPALLPTPELRP